jgi:hypothetical protein
VRKNLVEAVREIGPNGKRTRKALLSHLSQRNIDTAEGYAGTVLAELVNRGLLAKDRGGYCLPEWLSGQT